MLHKSDNSKVILSLSKLSAAPTLRKLCLIIFIYCIGLVAVRFALEHASLSILILTFVLMSWLQHAIMEEVHDGAHYRLFTNRRLNEVLGGFYSSLIGVSLTEFRRAHLRHHRYFGTTQDPDYPQYATCPTNWHGWLRYALSNFTGYAAVKGLLLRRYTISGGSSEERTFQHPSGTIILHAILMLVSVAVGVPFFHLIFWLLPLFTMTYGVAHFRTLLEHWTPESWIDPKSGEERRGALFNFTSDLQQHLLGAPFGYNKHGTHHSTPSIPDYNLDQAAEAIDYEDVQVYSTTYFARLRTVFGVGSGKVNRPYPVK